MTAPVSLPTRLHVVKSPAAPGSDEWSRLVTASKVAGIAGVSAYETRYSVWRLMNGIRVEASGMGDRYLTGHAMELALAYWWAEKNPEWRLSRGEVQVFNPGLPFDNAATLDRVATRLTRSRGPKSSRSVQFKTVSDWEEFSALSEDNIPADWLVQVTWEMLVSGLTQFPAALVVAGPYYKWVQFDIHFDEAFAADLVAVVVDFVATLDGEPPAPAAPNDYRIAKLAHPDIDDSADPVVLEPELVSAWREAKARQSTSDAVSKAAKADAEVLAARICEKLGKAAVAIDDTGSAVAKRVVGRYGVQLRHVKPPKPADGEPADPGGSA